MRFLANNRLRPQSVEYAGEAAVVNVEALHIVIRQRLYRGIGLGAIQRNGKRFERRAVALDQKRRARLAIDVGVDDFDPLLIGVI